MITEKLLNVYVNLPQVVQVVVNPFMQQLANANVPDLRVHATSGISFPVFAPCRLTIVLLLELFASGCFTPA
jgi:hypothetical protein